MGKPKVRKHQRPNKRNNNRKQVYISVALALLMVLSIMGIWASGLEQNTSFSYGGHDFKARITDNQNMYYTEINGKEIAFYRLPQDLINIPANSNLTTLLSPAQYMIVVGDPTSSMAPVIDLMRFDLSQNTHKFIINAIDTEHEGYTLPVLGCDNATKTTPVVVVTQSNVTDINVSNSCVNIQTRTNDVALIRDYLIYSSLGVYP